MLSRGLDEDIAPLVGEQFGVVTTAQLVALGVDRAGLRHLVRRGNLVGVTRGLYRSPYAPETREQLVFAACLVNGPAAAASHFTAAKLLGLDVAWPDQIVEITMPDNRHRNSLRGRIRVHTSASFESGDRTLRGRLRTTSVARTLADIAPQLSRRRVARVVDDALSKRLLQPSELVVFLDRLARSRRPGRGVLLATLEPWTAGTRPASVPEAEVLRLFDEWGFPPPVRQHRISYNGAIVARVDFAWPDQHVAVEVNGYRYHSNPQADARDSKRLSQIQAAGWVVVSVTPTELANSPASFRHALFTHLTQPRLLGGAS
jgi:hypothetical protein